MTTTNLDDLKTAWQTLNKNLERQHTLAFHQLKEIKMARFRSGLRPLAIGQVVQLICGTILAGLSARFWVKHLGTPHLTIYGMLLHGYGLMLTAFAVRDLVLVHRIDYAAPVVAIQKQIAALRTWHMRTGVWFAIVGCFIWVPLVLVIFYWLGADIWVKKPQVVYWFLVNSFVCMAFAYALIRWLRRHGRSDSSAGRSVNRAQAVLDELARFERE